MGIKISLPKVTKLPDAKIHTFPAQVGFQAMDFMRGVLFYAMISDVAAGKTIRQPGGLSSLEEDIISQGLSKEAWNDGWNCIEQYLNVFEQSVFQNVLILIRSHWDWYIRQTGDFVRFARTHVTSPPLTAKQAEQLARISFKEIKQQLSILERSCGISLNIAEDVLHDIHEMSLVRNIGLHNRWEVDSFYLEKTASNERELGEIRTIEIRELQKWCSSLTAVIREVTFSVAIKYVSAPDYPI